MLDAGNKFDCGICFKSKALKHKCTIMVGERRVVVCNACKSKRAGIPENKQESYKRISE